MDPKQDPEQDLGVLNPKPTSVRACSRAPLAYPHTCAGAPAVRARPPLHPTPALWAGPLRIDPGILGRPREVLGAEPVHGLDCRGILLVAGPLLQGRAATGGTEGGLSGTRKRSVLIRVTSSFRVMPGLCLGFV